MTTHILSWKISGSINSLQHPDSACWEESDFQCPYDSQHFISGCSKRVFCSNCGAYWNRTDIEKDKQADIEARTK